MIKNKPKIRIRRYSCYYCNCTGFHAKKQIIFQVWNWGYEFINRQICKYCNGKKCMYCNSSGFEQMPWDRCEKCFGSGTI